MQERSTNGRDKKRAEEFQQKNPTQKRNTKNEYATADQEWTGRAVKLSFEPKPMTPVSKNHSGSRITYDSHSEFINGTVFTHTTFPITPPLTHIRPPPPPPSLSPRPRTTPAIFTAHKKTENNYRENSNSGLEPGERPLGRWQTLGARHEDGKAHSAY